MLNELICYDTSGWIGVMEETIQIEIGFAIGIDTTWDWGTKSICVSLNRFQSR